MYIPFSDDQHRFVLDNSKNALEIQDKIQSERKFENFFEQNFFSDKILSPTKEILRFVSD